MHQEDIRKVTRSVMAGTETTRRPQNALMRMVKTPSRTRKKGSPFFGISQDSFATSPTRYQHPTPRHNTTRTSMCSRDLLSAQEHEVAAVADDRQRKEPDSVSTQLLYPHLLLSGKKIVS
jgi:hypothetical protein